MPLASYAASEACKKASMDLGKRSGLFERCWTRREWNAASVCCLMNETGSLLFCVFTSSLQYPERFAYLLLEDLMRSVEQLGGYDEASEKALTGALHETMR